MTAVNSTLQTTQRPRSVPVTDPLRVLLVDPDVVGGSALCHAIDLDREMAVVGFCRNLKRARQDANHCRPDLVAVRLSLDDDRCAAVLSELAAGEHRPCVVVLGARSCELGEGADASIMKARIRAVAEASLGLAPEPAPAVRRPSVAALH